MAAQFPPKFLFCPIIEPCDEIMVLFILHKLILQTHMRSHPVGLDVWFLVRPFVYVHTLCVQTEKALVRLRGCAGSPEPSLVTYVISTIISWAGSFDLLGTPTLFGRSFRRRFFTYHHAVKQPHISIILSWLSIPSVLKCAAKILTIG